MTVQFDQIDESLARSVPVGKSRFVTKTSGYAMYWKRPLDITLIVLAAPVVLPVIAILAFIVALDGGKPFYRNCRVGKYGRTFGMIKLRTMVKNADVQLEKFLDGDDDAKAEWAATQKLKSDPRITKFGRFLRKTSLDELPQLWNVLVGEMSLVGPRPMLPEQRAIYPGTAYYALRPGVTGTWQVSDRNNSEFSKRAEFDSEYESTISFTTDIGVIAKTFGAVMRGTGY